MNAETTKMNPLCFPSYRTSGLGAETGQTSKKEQKTLSTEWGLWARSSVGFPSPVLARVPYSSPSVPSSTPDTICTVPCISPPTLQLLPPLWSCQQAPVSWLPICTINFFPTVPYGLSRSLAWLCCKEVLLSAPLNSMCTVIKGNNNNNTFSWTKRRKKTCM